MGLLSRKRRRAGEEPGRPRAVLAAAMPIEGPDGKQAWQNSSGDAAWQKTAWYYYDAVGELRFAFNWLANAVSRATLYAAEVDPETGLITDATDNAQAQAVAAAILGGIEERPQLQSTMALHWQVPGETYVLVLPQPGQKPDRWIVLSRTGLREQGGTWSFKDPLTGVWTKIRPGQDKVIRIWSPHPDDQTHADSAMRAGIPICQEIEKAGQNIVARLDSRLAGNGVLFLPMGLDFPTADNEPADAQSFMKMLLEASEAAIAQPGTAAAHVPIMAQVPDELYANIANGHVDLSTAMDSAVPELREAAITRLGRTLDMPREIALGQVAEANHWSAWQIEETTYKIHVEPFLLKLGMALTAEFFRPALAAMGVADPERYVLAWDITEVVSRPDDSEATNYLWEQGVISEDYLLSKYGVPDDARPNDDERNLRRLERAVQVAPTLAADAQIAQLLFGLEIAPAAAGVADAGAVDAPALEAGDSTPSAGATPERDTTPPEPDAGLVAAAELVVFDALSRAGGRLLTPAYRGQFKAVPRHELHTVIPDNLDADRLMEGSFQFTANVAQAWGRDPDLLRRQLQAYVRHRLTRAMAHDRDTMIKYLSGS